MDKNIRKLTKISYKYIINYKVDNNIVDNEKTAQFLWPGKSGDPRECLLQKLGMLPLSRETRFRQPFWLTACFLALLIANSSTSIPANPIPIAIWKSNSKSSFLHSRGPFHLGGFSLAIF